jgi:hypothetical protein
MYCTIERSKLNVITKPVELAFSVTLTRLGDVGDCPRQVAANVADVATRMCRSRRIFIFPSSSLTFVALSQEFRLGIRSPSSMDPTDSLATAIFRPRPELRRNQKKLSVRELAWPHLLGSAAALRPPVQKLYGRSTRVYDRLGY